MTSSLYILNPYHGVHNLECWLAPHNMGWYSIINANVVLQICSCPCLLFCNTFTCHPLNSSLSHKHVINVKVEGARKGEREGGREEKEERGRQEYREGGEKEEAKGALQYSA